MSNKSGFTVFELLIALAIMGIMAAIAVPYMMADMTGGGLKQALEQVNSDFHRTKMLAITRQTNCTFLVNTPGVNQYTIDVNGTAFQTVDLAEYGGDVVFDIGPLTPGSTDVTFTPQGLSNPSGSVYLRDMHGRGSPEVYEVRASGAGGISKIDFIDRVRVKS